jgi:tetratricopeptide (TPR) repeat protein
MKTLPVLLALTLCLVLTSAAAAAEQEEIMLRSGLTAMVEVVETGPESVTVKFTTKEGGSGTTKLRADNMDPHSFYEIRKRHMEKTVENHVRLAVWLASNGLFKRAKRQMDAARALEPDLDEKIEAMPDVMEGIADHLVKAAKRHYEKGDLELCYEIASLLATRFPETAGGMLARDVLEELAQEVEEKAQAKERKREAAIQAEQDAEKKKAAQARDTVLDNLERSLSLGRRHMNTGLQERNQSQARRAFDAAAQQFTRLLGQIEKAKGSAKGDETLVQELTQLEGDVRNEAVRANINAGNILLTRGSRNQAMRYAEAAIALDPESGAAKSFMNNVRLAAAMSGWGRWR